MEDVRPRQGSLAHYPVAWQASPTRFDVQTSQPVTDREPRPGHRGRTLGKGVAFLPFDVDQRMLLIECRLDKSVEQPLDAGGANGVIRSLETQVLGDVSAPLEIGSLAC